MDDKVKEFWGAFEAETGEKVEARSEGNWIHGTGPAREGQGLLILTDKSFRFKYVPDAIRPFVSSRMTPESENRAEFIVERRDIVSVRGPKRGIFARLFRRAFPRCSFVARSASGEKTYVFSADPSSGLIAALEKAWPSFAGAVVH
jgi:hypothetical protein